MALPVPRPRPAPARRGPVRWPRHRVAPGGEGGGELGEEVGVGGGGALGGGEGLVGRDRRGDDAEVGRAGRGQVAEGCFDVGEVGRVGRVLGFEFRVGGEEFGQLGLGPVEDRDREGAGEGRAVGAQFGAEAGDLGAEFAAWRAFTRKGRSGAEASSRS